MTCSPLLCRRKHALVVIPSLAPSPLVLSCCSSEGKKKAKIELAHAETTALEAVADAVEVDGCSQTDFALFNQYNDFVRDAAPRASDKVGRSFNDLDALGLAAQARPHLPECCPFLPVSSSQTIFLPYDTTAVTGLISRLPSSYGRASAPSVGAGGAAAATRGAAADDALN